MNDGVLMTTGSVFGTRGPNNSPIMGIDNNRPATANLPAWPANPPTMPWSPEFDFVPISDKVEFKYVFAGRRVPGIRKPRIQRRVRLFLSGNGIAGTVNLNVLPETDEIVSVNSINDRKNAQYFIDNGSTLTRATKWAPTAPKFTTTSCNGTVLPPCSRLRTRWCRTKNTTSGPAIADAGDGVVDSGVYLKSKSFRSVGTAATPPPVENHVRAHQHSA